MTVGAPVPSIDCSPDRLARCCGMLRLRDFVRYVPRSQGRLCRYKKNHLWNTLAVSGESCWRQRWGLRAQQQRQYRIILSSLAPPRSRHKPRFPWP